MSKKEEFLEEAMIDPIALSQAPSALTKKQKGNFDEEWDKQTEPVKKSRSGSSTGVSEFIISAMAYIALIIHIIVAIIFFNIGEEWAIWVGVVVILSALPFFGFWRTLANISFTLNSINNKLHILIKE